MSGGSHGLRDHFTSNAANNERSVGGIANIRGGGHQLCRIGTTRGAYRRTSHRAPVAWPSARPRRPRRLSLLLPAYGSTSSMRTTAPGLRYPSLHTCTVHRHYRISRAVAGKGIPALCTRPINTDWTGSLGARRTTRRWVVIKRENTQLAIGERQTPPVRFWALFGNSKAIPVARSGCLICPQALAAIPRSAQASSVPCGILCGCFAGRPASQPANLLHCVAKPDANLCNLGTFARPMGECRQGATSFLRQSPQGLPPAALLGSFWVLRTPRLECGDT